MHASHMEHRRNVAVRETPRENVLGGHLCCANGAVGKTAPPAHHLSASSSMFLNAASARAGASVSMWR